MFSLLIMLLGCAHPSIGFADTDFNFDDTGSDTTSSFTLDPVDLWPAKIVLDAAKNAMMLVWFDTDTPRHTTIAFTDIKELLLVPKYENRPQELQVHLHDGRKFLIDFGNNAIQTSQTFIAVTLTTMNKGSTKGERILPVVSIQRNVPILTVGSVDSPEAIAPPSTVVVSENIPQKSVTLQEIGEKIDITASNGEVSRTTVDMTIKENMNRFRACYLKEVGKNPNLGGRVDVQFSINPEGRIKGARILESSLGNEAVEACLLRQIQGLTFDPPKNGDAVITYPFIFSMSGL